MFNFLKKMVSYLPHRYQQELKRYYYARQIHNGKFSADEKEYFLLESLILPGDWVLDVGANIGNYTEKFSELVGEKGRVIALEPIIFTFELLVSNSKYFKYKNVTLLNLGASDISKIINMEVPTFKTGLKNYFEAKITDKKTDYIAFVIPMDSISIPHKIKLVKIDTEGHELSVLRGMNKLLSRDHPTLIVEASSYAIVEYLNGFRYSMERLDGSPNYIFRHIDS